MTVNGVGGDGSGGSLIPSHPADWPDVGWQAVFPVLAEQVVAEHHWAEDQDTVWIGGRNAGFDVKNRLGRTDAKVAWLGTGSLVGRLCFAAPEHGFDNNKVDFIAPVILEGPSVGHDYSPSGSGRLIATYGSASLWVIPVDIVNSAVEYHSKGRSSVPLATVERYRATPGVPRPTP